MRVTPRMLIVTSGQRTDRPFRNIQGFDIDSIYVEALQYHNLWGYTAVVIASWTNELTLANSLQKLSKFVNKGGILVCLGCQANEAQWIPFCQWAQAEPKTASWQDTGQDYKLIFDNVQHDLLMFHEYYGHGILEPPNNAKIMGLGEESPIMCLIDEGTQGAALITTIDPDLHAQTGTRTISKEREDDKKAEARKLLSNIFNWCVWKFNQRHTLRAILWRKFLGVFRMRTFYCFSTLVLWPTSILITIKYFWGGNYDLWIAIPSSASIIALAIMITDKYFERRRLFH